MNLFADQYAKLRDSIAAKAGATTSETEAYLNLGRMPISREAELRFQNPTTPYTAQERRFIDENHLIARNLPQIAPNPAVTTGEPVPDSKVKGAILAKWDAELRAYCDGIMEKITVPLNKLCKEIGVTNKRERQFGKVFLGHLKRLENKSALDSTSQDILNTIGKILSALESIKATNNANWESNRKLLRERFTGLENKIASDTTSQGILNTLQETHSFLISYFTTPKIVPANPGGKDKRGRKPMYDRNDDEKMYDRWNRASKGGGTSLKDFCRDNKIKHKNFIKLMARVRRRKNYQSK